MIYNKLHYKSQTLPVNHKIHINILFTKIYDVFSEKNTFDAGIIYQYTPTNYHGRQDNCLDTHGSRAYNILSRHALKGQRRYAVGGK